MDSKVVLGFVSKEPSRFHIYVANRVELNHDHTTPPPPHSCSGLHHLGHVTNSWKEHVGISSVMSSMSFSFCNRVIVYLLLVFEYTVVFSQ